MILGISDPDNFTFSQQLADHWRSLGHEVRQSLYHEKSYAEECDAVFYDFLSVAPREMTIQNERCKRCVVRGIDIELYDGYWEEIDFKMVDHLIFISEAHRRMMEERMGEKYPKEIVSVVPPGINMDKYTLVERPIETNKKALYLGRNWIAKNHIGALDVVYELNKLDPGWSLEVRGDGADPNWWRQYCKNREETMGIKVEYVGRVDDVNAYMKQFELVIVPSFKEAFSYTACEALAQGIPVLINNFYGSREIWPDEIVYNTPSEAAFMYFDNLIHKEPKYFRDIASKYDEKIMFNKIDKMMGII